MLSHLLGGSHYGHDERLKNPIPAVAEVIPSPDSTRSNMSLGSPEPEDDIQTVETVTTARPAATPTKKLPKRQSFFGRVADTVHSWFHETTEHVQQQHTIIQTKVRKELGAGVSGHILETSHDDLVAWISAERMRSVPHKGGSWDRVLSAASHFADQIKELHACVTFTDGTTGLVYGQCLLLLELGDENAETLEKAFQLWYSFGVDLRPLLRRADLFDKSKEIQSNLGKAYVSLMDIVTDVAIDAYQAVHGLKSTHATISYDIFSSSESQIEAFHSRLDRCRHEMWAYTLTQKHISDGKDIEMLRRWLAPPDSVLAFLASSHISLAANPAPFTCDWLQKPLKKFIQGEDDIMMVEGKNGSGKTVLANWTLDRLQKSIGRKQVLTVNFAFNPSINAQATPQAMLKTLLYELIERAVGNLGVYRSIKELCQTSEARDASEEQLWTALHKALQAVNEEKGDEIFVIVLDGLDEINSSSKSTAQKVCNRLHDIVKPLELVRILQFSEPLGLSPSRATKVDIKEKAFDDTVTMIQEALKDHEHFADKDFIDQDQLVHSLAELSHGSLLWGSLACAILRLKKTHHSFNKAIEELKVLKSIPDIVQHFLGVSQLGQNSKLVLSFLVTAERPLTFAEIKLLLQVNTERSTLSDVAVDFGCVLKALSPLIVVQEGLVAVRHAAVEQAIISIPNKSDVSLHLTERHRDLLLRLFIYAKSCLHETHRPTFDPLDMSNTLQKFHDNRLLEYTVRYWTVHFKRSKLMKATGPLDLPSDITSAFPKSVIFALLERACFDALSVHDALEMHLLAHRVRSACFGSKDACVLQSTITCAILLAFSRQSEAVEYYHSAVESSRAVLGLQSEITLACCNYVIQLSETLITKQRTTITTCREKALLVVVEIYSHTYGRSSKQIVEIYQKLVELYVLIGEESHATKYRKIIYEITIQIDGSRSFDQVNDISRNLEVVLKRKSTETIDTYDGDIFAGTYNEHKESLTIEYVRIILVRIEECRKHGQFEKAEELYIELWLRITEHCHLVNLVEWHEQKIRIMLLYATFLQERKRLIEASSLLICIWQEYEHHEHSRSESIIVVLKEVAVLMTTLTMFAFALSVLQKCRSWYISTHKEHLDVFKHVEVLISETSVEIVKSTTVTKSSETVMREVFESSLSSTEISTTTIKLCESLSSIFIKEKRWSEAVTSIEKTIRKSWSSFFEESIHTMSLTTTFTHESVELVQRLIECYISMSRFETAEYYYLRLFRAIKTSCKVEDQLFVKYTEIILAFYEKHGYYNKAIAFYQELLVTYRVSYGSSHAMTIQILYALGDLCRKYQRTHGYWIEYYMEILLVLNKGSVICHEDALRALIVVARCYYEDCRYSESLQYFKCILATFVKHGKAYKFFQNTVEVQEIFEYYFRSLVESKTEISVQISLIKEYREACVHVFGATSSIVIHATFTLAEVCTRSEKHQFEAISFYELVAKHSQSTEIITRSTTTMRSLYVKQVTSTSTTTITKETLERAISYSYERYEEIRKTYSCTHETVLSHFKELFVLYYKASKIETATKELFKLAVECITTVIVAKELIETSKFLSALLIGCSLEKQAWELVHELRLQTIYRSTKNVAKWGFNVTTIGRRCFSFLAAFEYHLRAIYSITIADYMAEIMAEHIYYERFCSHIKNKMNFDMVFAIAARLRQTLSKHERLEYFSVVEKETVEYFFHTETTVVKGTSKAAIEGFVSLLLEYFTAHSIVTDQQKFVAACGHAAEARIRLLISQKKHREAAELTKCTYAYLMAHDGLDDKTEIALGFRLAVLMSKIHERELSKQILGEVLDICDKEEIDLVRLKLTELNDLICLIGEQKDYKRLLRLLTAVWKSRERQSSWESTTVLKEQKLGKRLVQARFLGDHKKQAIKLCQDIVYNVRRVYGVRHKLTLSMSTILASLYISTGLNEIKQNNETTAKFYFRKAIELHVNDLKTIVSDEDDESSDDSDSDMASVGSTSVNGIAQVVTNGVNPSVDKNVELKAVRDHLRLLKLAFQRSGSFTKPKEIENLTAKAWAEFGSELKMKKEEVLSSHWTATGYGNGKAESNEDDFREPKSWSITAKN